MTNSIAIKARMEPFGKPSIRVVKRRGGKPHSYWPINYTEACKTFDAIARLAMEAQGFDQPLSGPLQVHIVAAKRPTQAIRSARKRGIECPRHRVVKPDGDNVQKAIYDALTRCGVIEDDRFLSLQITESVWSEYDRGYILVAVNKL